MARAIEASKGGSGFVYATARGSVERGRWHPNGALDATIVGIRRRSSLLANVGRRTLNPTHICDIGAPTLAHQRPCNGGRPAVLASGVSKRINDLFFEGAESDQVAKVTTLGCI